MFGLIWTLLVGAFAGFLAGHILRGRGYGALANTVLGVLGSILAGIFLWLVGFHTHSIIADVVAATAGAVALVYFFGSRRHGGRGD